MGNSKLAILGMGGFLFARLKIKRDKEGALHWLLRMMQGILERKEVNE